MEKRERRRDGRRNGRNDKIPRVKNRKRTEKERGCKQTNIRGRHKEEWRQTNRD